MLKLILLSLILVGCGKQEAPKKEEPSFSRTEKSFEAFTASFLAEAAKYNKTVSTEKKSTLYKDDTVFKLSYELTENFLSGGNPLGECIRYNLKVQLKTSYWNTASDMERESTLFHELGHCLLGREHVDGNRENGQPVSLMAPVSFSVKVYAENRDYYMQELFSNSK